MTVSFINLQNVRPSPVCLEIASVKIEGLGGLAAFPAVFGKSGLCGVIGPFDSVYFHRPGLFPGGLLRDNFNFMLCAGGCSKDSHGKNVNLFHSC